MSVDSPLDPAQVETSLSRATEELKLTVSALKRKNKKRCAQLQDSVQSLTETYPVSSRVHSIHSSAQSLQVNREIGAIKLMLVQLWEATVEEWFDTAATTFLQTVEDKLRPMDEAISRCFSKVTSRHCLLRETGQRDSSFAAVCCGLRKGDVLLDQCTLKTAVYLFCNVIPELTAFAQDALLSSSTSRDLGALREYNTLVNNELKWAPLHSLLQPFLKETKAGEECDELYDALFHSFMRDIHVTVSALLRTPKQNVASKYIDLTHSLCYAETEILKGVQFYQTRKQEARSALDQ
ncbi:hypothetical protein AGDE_15064 [Angomonas deanei]|nr:hypothetical protein AGDE_15064 [Angomonas deanei]|eukprot:EPY19744.1 hypothetical protein AGDE_15064 [Angomonas deanei]